MATDPLRTGVTVIIVKWPNRSVSHPPTRLEKDAMTRMAAAEMVGSLTGLEKESPPSAVLNVPPPHTPP